MKSILDRSFLLASSGHYFIECTTTTNFITVTDFTLCETITIGTGTTQSVSKSIIGNLVQQYEYLRWDANSLATYFGMLRADMFKATVNATIEMP